MPLISGRILLIFLVAGISRRCLAYMRSNYAAQIYLKDSRNTIILCLSSSHRSYGAQNGLETLLCFHHFTFLVCCEACLQKTMDVLQRKPNLESVVIYGVSRRSS